LDFPIRAGDRAIFLGPPYAGKTNLVCALMGAGVGGRPVPSAVFMDSKQHPMELAEWGPRNGYFVTRDPLEIRRHALVVYQVDQLALEDRGGWGRPGSVGYSWTLALKAAFERGNTIVEFNEALQTMPVQAPHPDARRMMTQGSAYRVSTWIESQAGNWIDTLAMRLAEHAFAFRMTDSGWHDDIRKARGVRCDVLASLPEGAFQFAYHRRGMDAWVVCAPAPLVVRPRHADGRMRPPAATRGASAGDDASRGDRPGRPPDGREPVAPAPLYDRTRGIRPAG
jgi:hypothetical protein